MMECPYCESDGFNVINQTAEYSGIEVTVDRHGLLRVRTYTNDGVFCFEAQDIVEIKYCPLCGKAFKK